MVKQFEITAVIWSEEAFGRPFYDTFWQTETGAIMIANVPGVKVKPGSMGKPFPGIEAGLLDLRTMEPISDPGTVGLLAFRTGWPSMFQTYWKNEETYRSKFVDGWYVSRVSSGVKAILTGPCFKSGLRRNISTAVMISATPALSSAPRSVVPSPVTMSMPM